MTASEDRGITVRAKIIVKSIIFNKAHSRILLIQRSNTDDIGADSWENAGGNVECGETPEQAMKREIREETGIEEILIKRIAYVTLVNSDDPYLIIAYLCESQTENVALSDEHQAFVWADQRECIHMLPEEIIGDFEKNKIFDYFEIEKETMIIPAKTTDESVLALFSQHDDFMIDFLGDDKGCYTRYHENEKLENVWLVVLDNVPAGCIAYRQKADGVGEVKRLYIKEEYRGRGISRELLETVECHAKEQGCHTLFCDTRITLEPAVSLYRASGFHIVFQQGLYIQMEKDICDKAKEEGSCAD